MGWKNCWWVKSEEFVLVGWLYRVEGGYWFYDANTPYD